VEGLLTGVHNITSLCDPDAVDELRKCLVFNKTLGEKGTQQTSTVRLLAVAGKGARNLLSLVPGSICEQLEERRQEFGEGVNVSEVKLTNYGDGGGIAHSDGTGATDLTAAKMIVKPGACGTLLTQGEDGKWRFIQITSKEYVLLPTTTGARLHCAARLVLVGQDTDGTLIFEAVNEQVLSIIINIGPPGRGENPTSFLEEATGFAEGYPEGVGPVRPPLPSLQLSAREKAKKVRAWEALMAPERAELAMTAAAKREAEAEKEVRHTRTRTQTQTRTRTLTLTIKGGSGDAGCGGGDAGCGGGGEGETGGEARGSSGDAGCCCGGGEGETGGESRGGSGEAGCSGGAAE